MLNLFPILWSFLFSLCSFYIIKIIKFQPFLFFKKFLGIRFALKIYYFIIKKVCLLSSFIDINFAVSIAARENWIGRSNFYYSKDSWKRFVFDYLIHGITSSVIYKGTNKMRKNQGKIKKSYYFFLPRFLD